MRLRALYLWADLPEEIYCKGKIILSYKNISDIFEISMLVGTVWGSA